VPSLDDIHREKRAVEELPRVFYDHDDAVLLAIKAGYPKERMPEFRTSDVFWAKVLEGLGMALCKVGRDRF
jgi:hypothetical protein